MTLIDPSALLAKLGAGVDPTDRARSPITRDFADVLARVNGGRASGIPISFDPMIPDQGIDPDTIGRAADLATIRGMRTALVDLGGSILRVDVTERRVDAQFDPRGELVVDGIDGYVRPRPPGHTDVSDDQTSTDAPMTMSKDGPARVMRNASLVHALSGAAHP